MTSDGGPTQQPDDGPWLELWLSTPRLGRYLAASGGDRERALRLYDWNARISAALLCDLAHFEVALRNAYDRALMPATPSGQTHWTFASAAVFPPVYRTKRIAGGATQHTDINRKPRELLDAAVAAAGGRSASPGKVIANLTFGFWRYLSVEGSREEPVGAVSSRCVPTEDQPQRGRRQGRSPAQPAQPRRSPRAASEHKRPGWTRRSPVGCRAP